MDELGPESRALLDAARDGLSPDPAAIRRVHGRIHAAAAGSTVGTALGIKLGIAGLIAVLAIAGGIYLRRAPAASPAASPSVELARAVERPERESIRRGDSPAPLRVATADPGAAPPHAAVAGAHSAAAGATPRAEAGDPHRPAGDATSSRTTAAGSHRAAFDAAAPRASGATGDAQRTGVAAPTAAIELGREVALIDLAMSALRRDDAAAALRVVEEYAAEAGEGGQLRQDAAAIEIEALCKLGDPRARDRRTAFDARFPHSVQRARLEAACR